MNGLIQNVSGSPTGPAGPAVLGLGRTRLHGVGRPVPALRRREFITLLGGAVPRGCCSDCLQSLRTVNRAAGRSCSEEDYGL